MTLFIILGVLFAVLAVVVYFTERHGKPMSAEQQSKLSRISIILIFVLLVAGLIKAMVS